LLLLRSSSSCSPDGSAAERVISLNALLASWSSSPWRYSFGRGALAPHHRSPTSALWPAGQDLGTAQSREVVRVPLGLDQNASVFWIMFLLIAGSFWPKMIDAVRPSAAAELSRRINRWMITSERAVMSGLAHLRKSTKFDVFHRARPRLFA